MPQSSLADLLKVNCIKCINKAYICSYSSHSLYYNVNHTNQFYILVYRIHLTCHIQHYYSFQDSFSHTGLHTSLQYSHGYSDHCPAHRFCSDRETSFPYFLKCCPSRDPVAEKDQQDPHWPWTHGQTDMRTVRKKYSWLNLKIRFFLFRFNNKYHSSTV